MQVPFPYFLNRWYFCVEIKIKLNIHKMADKEDVKLYQNPLEATVCPMVLIFLIFDD
jgi:hypothetical protein